MKYIYLIISLVLITLLHSCKAQNNNLKQKKMKTFDIETFNKNKIQTVYRFITKDSTIIWQNEDSDKYLEIINKKNSPFEFQNRYYKTGQLKMEVKRYSNNFIIYLKEYDQQGNLIKETDYDKPFKFTFKDILKFIEKRGIDMKGDYFRITRNFDFGTQEESSDNPFWSITWDKNPEKMILGRIIINGITGEIIKEFEENHPE